MIEQEAAAEFAAASCFGIGSGFTAPDLRYIEKFAFCDIRKFAKN